MKMLLDRVKSLVAWTRTRPLRSLIILIAIESLVFLTLLCVFIWLLLTR